MKLSCLWLGVEICEDWRFGARWNTVLPSWIPARPIAWLPGQYLFRAVRLLRRYAFACHVNWAQEVLASVENLCFWLGVSIGGLVPAELSFLNSYLHICLVAQLISFLGNTLV